MTDFRHVFNGTAGADKAAYLALDSIFRGDPPLRAGWQTHKDRYEELQAQKWLLGEDDDPAPVLEAMQYHLRAQARILHDPAHDVAGLLQRAAAEIPHLDEWERGNLVRMNHIYRHQSGFLEPGLIERYERTLAKAEHDWIAHFDEDNPREGFARQIVPFENALGVIRESVTEPARRMGVAVSEAALDLLNPGVTNAMIDDILARIKPGYPALVAAAAAHNRHTPAPLPLPAIPTDVQLRIFDRIKDEMVAGAGWTAEKLAATDVRIAPLATSATGFCWGSNKDITISIESYEDNFLAGLNNTWHETGHMLYLLHLNTLPAQAQGRPVGQFNGFGAHESAAIFMEHAGTRPRAMELCAPVIREELVKARDEGLLPDDFDVDDPALAAANLHAAANRPNLDDTGWGSSELALLPNMAWRVLALRRLLDEPDDFNATDLPQFWADTMAEWTGIPHDPEDFQIGESHVFEGLGGYFWAYMTGAFSAATLQAQTALQAAAHDAQADNLRDYTRLYHDTLRDRLFAAGSKEEPLEALRRMLNGVDPHDTTALLARLAPAADWDPMAKPGPRNDVGPH